MKKKLAIFLALVMMIAAMAGCGEKTDASTDDGTKAETSGESENAGSNKAIEDMTFAYVVASTNDYWTRLQAGAEDAAAANGIELLETITKEGDIPAAVAAVDAAVGQGVDAIICACGDPAAFIDTINAAVKKGITVVTVDQDSAESDRQYFVGTSNYDSGYQMGEWFLEQVGDTEQKVAVYAGTITAQNAVDRMNGFKDAVAGHDNVEIITYEQVNNDVQITMDKTYALFNGYPEVTAIYGVFAYDPLGAAKACKELGRDDVFVFGFDDLEESVELMNEGWIKGLAVQQPYEIGELAVETMLSAVKGEGPEPGEIGTGVKIITAENQ